jgi:hypothetical protein
MPLDAHLSDQELLQAADGELSAADARRAEAHLAACWTCRSRKQEIDGAIAEYIHVHQEASLPPVDGPRALLKAQLARMEVQGTHRWPRRWAIAAAACALLALGLAVSRTTTPVEAAVSVPNSSLTPGATVRLSPGELCRADKTKNRAVPVALQRRVFEEYGIKGAEPRAYEVDYLITPALGGAEDIHNLWPQSYSATVWNARVKDALEDRLRELVCDGNLDLATAQQEIAVNWIEAYKKYFNTDTPLEISR